MFGPNNKPKFHHRGDQFQELYYELEEYFLTLANLDPLEWRVIFITGSGTVANEIMCHSVVPDINVITHGHFSSRFRNYLDYVGKLTTDSENGQVAVLYETSESNYKKDLITRSSNSKPKIVLADCVSAFPYYDIPDEVDIWTTVSGKQLGCHPGISMVVLKKELVYSGLIKPIEPSYLSLAKYLDYSDRWQTPNTPAISLMEELVTALQEFDVRKYRKMIDDRREKILELIGGQIESVGEGPVLTLKLDKDGFIPLNMTHLINHFDLYNHSSGGPQIFLWSGDDEQYDELYKFLKKEFTK